MATPSAVEAAFARTPRLRPDQLERALSVAGDTTRLRRRLVNHEPLTFATIGDSNVVRGGCHAWQRSKCSEDPRYTNRSSVDGAPHGWLLQAFEALNRTWPNARHRLLNHAMMGTGPSAFSQCLNSYVPPTADVVLIGFADMCWDSFGSFWNSSYGLHFERIVRELRMRTDPPSLVFFNYYRWLDRYVCRGQVCRFYESCEGERAGRHANRALKRPPHLPTRPTRLHLSCPCPYRARVTLTLSQP